MALRSAFCRHGYFWPTRVVLLCDCVLPAQSAAAYLNVRCTRLLIPPRHTDDLGSVGGHSRSSWASVASSSYFYIGVFMRILRAFLLTLFFAVVVSACATKSVSHDFYYNEADNPDIFLIDWEYSIVRQRPDRLEYRLKKEQSVGGISWIGLSPVGDFIRVRWKVKSTGEIKEQVVSLKGVLPFNMAGAQIRPTFNSDGELEVYVFYQDPSGPNFYSFKGAGYSNQLMRKVYPVVKEIPPPVRK